MNLYIQVIHGHSESPEKNFISVPGESGVKCANNKIIAEFLMKMITVRDLFIKLTRNLYIKKTNVGSNYSGFGTTNGDCIWS